MEIILLVSLYVLACLVFDIFAGENIAGVIVYNGAKYPVKVLENGKLSCRLFGAVARYARKDNLYNVFGYVVEVE